MVEGSGDLVAMAERPDKDSRLERLEAAISGTIHALREEFHRTASVSTRQEVLDTVAALFFAHVTSIDSGGRGIGQHLKLGRATAVKTLNDFVVGALTQHLALRKGESSNGGRLTLDRFFAPLSESDERFAEQILGIFERDAGAFQDLHKAGRDDLINEVFSRFMSTSFVDEKEMGQYLTPTEIVRFMVEVGFHALNSDARDRILQPSGTGAAGIILDPSCGVGSFLAEIIRRCHSAVRERHSARKAAHWLQRFVENRVVGIDKSERMTRLAMINLGLFGAAGANVRLANGLARVGEEGEANASFEGRVELILTNPPFGATYSGADITSFAMGHGRSKAESEVLFLERYLDWVAPGGVIVSVVPDSVLVNRGAFSDLRAWLKDRCSIEAVFSLPPVTFGAAGTSTKTSVLVLRKHDKVAAAAATYFGEARDVGFDVVTRSGQRRRVRSARTDLPVLLEEFRGLRPIRFGRRSVLTSLSERWDAAFQVGLPDNIASLVENREATLLKVADVAALVDERTDPRRGRSREFDYVEISDVDTRTALVGHKRILRADAPSRARKVVQAGDVLVSTVRPERGAIGLIPARLDGAICSTGFAVLRCSAIHPLALVWLLKTELVRKQMIRNNIGIAYPAISEVTCLDLVLPVTRAELASLSEAADELVKVQETFEGVHTKFRAKVESFDRAVAGLASGLCQFPDIIDAAKPGTIPDVA
ncbi:MAG: N-6 DNA methylase [Pseudorhodoplanes sp.]|nr:N-6 DNA methylase [Pseudorhodoplanes sp.]